MMSNLGPFQTGFRVQSSEFSFSCRFEVISSRIFWNSSRVQRCKSEQLCNKGTAGLLLHRSKDRLVGPKRKVDRAPRRTFSRALLGKAVMARTKPHHRTVEQQATWEAQQAADAREAAEAAARRTRRGLRASRDEVDEELILPVPNTELEEPGNHLTGRRRKTTLVLVLLLATLAIGSRGALWRRERLLWEEYCGKMLRSEFTRMYRMDPSTFAYLVDALSPRIDKNFFQAERAGGYISPQLRVAITIRWLAGVSYLDLKVKR